MYGYVQSATAERLNGQPGPAIFYARQGFRNNAPVKNADVFQVVRRLLLVVCT